MTVESVNSTNVYASAMAGSSNIALSPDAMMLLLRRRLSDMDGQIDGMLSEIESNTQRAEAIQRQTEGMLALKSALSGLETNQDVAHRLDAITVTFNGETMTAEKLLNDLGITELQATGYEGVSLEERRVYEEAKASLESAHAQVPPPSENFFQFQTIYEGGDALRGDPELRALYEEHVDAANTVRSLRVRADYQGNDTVSGTQLDSFIQQLQSAGRRTNSGNDILMVQMQSAMQQRSQAVTMCTQMTKGMGDTMKEIARNMA